jgi:regulator of sigma E protease
MNALIELLAFAVAIGVLVTVHEYGHYRVARWCGVRVLRFSIGFGTPLLRWVDRRSGTEWSLGALPLGGYVKMLDERESDTPLAAGDLPHAFNRQSLPKRAAIVAAGPLANFLFAIVVSAAVFAGGITEPAALLARPAPQTAAAQAGLSGGETVLSVHGESGDAQPVRSWSELGRRLEHGAGQSVIVRARQAGGSVRDYRVDLAAAGMPAASDDESDGGGAWLARLGFEPGGGPLSIVSVQPGSAAEQAGLRPGDTLLALDGVPLAGSARLIDTIKAHAGRALAFEVGRAGATRNVTIVPQQQRDEMTGAPIGRIGALFSLHTPLVTVHYGVLDSLALGATRTWEVARDSLLTFGRMLLGQASLRNLSGPVAIADYAGKSAQLGWSAFASFLALVSISLGVLNLLPIPVLDGGHLLYYLVEAATGKAIPEHWQAFLQRAGVICIIILSSIALCNDLARLVRF